MEDLQELAKKFHLQPKSYKKVLEGPEQLSEITNSKFWDDFLNLSPDNGAVKEFFKQLENEDREKYLQFGISCLVYFVQANFSGPPIPENVDKFLQAERYQNGNFFNTLSMNNEDININTRYPVLLVAAEAIFDGCIVNELVNLWWCCRALVVHQDILDELSPTLLSNADRLHKILQGIPLDVNMQAQLDIEMAQMYLKFRHISKAKDHITSVSELLGIEYNLIGKMGKRTKHQQKELAQLTLSINITEKEGVVRQEVEEVSIPKNLGLNDEVRLDNIEFSSKTDVIKLPHIEQKLILNVVQYTLIASPPDELQIEELLPFLENLINQNNTYCVRVVALLLRSKLECKNKRTIERCLNQCEDIINCFSKEEPPAHNRVDDVFGTALPPIWKIQAQYADMLLNYGLVKNSLEVYLKIKLWEEVIVCYTILKLRHKAVELIKQQLEVKPTVKLMCLLGDATDDVSCYEKAWNMSKKRSHRAQRHWGQFLFARKRYAECVPHFEKSLSINPLQSSIWLGLGFAALQIENWQTAATAYRRYTTLEPDGFEAWNNLAQAYIKMGNKRSAHQAILEALKCNFDNWKVWENLLLVSCDISNFSDVIRAYHRLLDLKEKYLNTDVLNVLVYSVCNDANDSEGQPAKRFLQKTRELVGRVTALYPSNGLVWELYASLAPALLLRAQRLQRAYRGYTQGAWDKNPKTCFQVLNVCSKLADVVLQEEIDPTNTILSSIKLNLYAAVTAVKKQDWEETKVLFKEVCDQLEQVLVKLMKGNTAFEVVS